MKYCFLVIAFGFASINSFAFCPDEIRYNVPSELLPVLPDETILIIISCEDESAAYLIENNSITHGPDIVISEEEYTSFNVRVTAAHYPSEYSCNVSEEVVSCERQACHRATMELYDYQTKEPFMENQSECIPDNPAESISVNLSDVEALFP